MIMRTEGGKLKGVFFLLILMWGKRDFFGKCAIHSYTAKVICNSYFLKSSMMLSDHSSLRVLNAKSLRSTQYLLRDASLSLTSSILRQLVVCK